MVEVLLHCKENDGNIRSSIDKSKPRMKTKVECTLYSQFRGYLPKRKREILIVVLYIWLLINTDPAGAYRTLSSMVLTRVINKAIGNSGLKLQKDDHRGLSTIEAIALIQAMNANNQNRNNPLYDQINHQQSPGWFTGSSMRQASTDMMTRQLPVPIPRPIPFPLPIPIVAVFAAFAAFFAAVASGMAPMTAIVAAFVAAFVAILAIIIALVSVVVVKPQKKSPIVKKLVIKKTVLPFVIPIPYKQKEKEIVYKYIPKHESHHEEELKIKNKHKHKKFEMMKDEDPDQSGEESNMLAIEKLLLEQDQLQDAVNGLTQKMDSSRRRLGKSVVSHASGA